MEVMETSEANAPLQEPLATGSATSQPAASAATRGKAIAAVSPSQLKQEGEEGELDGASVSSPGSPDATSGAHSASAVAAAAAVSSAEQLRELDWHKIPRESPTVNLVAPLFNDLLGQCGSAPHTPTLDQQRMATSSARTSSAGARTVFVQSLEPHGGLAAPASFVAGEGMPQTAYSELWKPPGKTLARLDKAPAVHSAPREQALGGAGVGAAPGTAVPVFGLEAARHELPTRHLSIHFPHRLTPLGGSTQRKTLLGAAFRRLSLRPMYHLCGESWGSAQSCPSARCFLRIPPSQPSAVLTLQV
ncbi:hypothetical protein BESB_025150 [Besnoitia besnoiti]|uniref:Uncharacterized protein n=1 Tax=Besnoitia besnoiti TaxID=94643 RepID=A0A2A9M0R8_BESBE|nr:uncharacterized protein BESB_025150 [Besnoitia besnoiti]PFH31549.1 hypothetical protein BESB_025150 [Besnoitia besnoiti]